MRFKNFLDISLLQIWEILELHGPTQGCSLLCPADCGIPKSHQLLQATASSSSHSQLWTSACPWLVYIYNAVSYALRFPEFTGTNKVLDLICIWDTVKSVENVTALECCDDSLVEWLLEWGGGVGQTLNLVIQKGKTKILKVPLGILKDKEDPEC